ncbi:MAG: hypothetical protein ACRDQ7_15075 [Haloechinothrix sp.]
MAGDTGFSDESRAATAPGGSRIGAGAGMEDVSGFDSASVDRFHEGATQFKELAKQGKFAVNEDAMKAFTKVCDMFLDGWDEQQFNLRILAQPARMGSNEYARKIAEYNVKVANGDERALIPNFELMAEGYQTMKEALVIARRNYDEAESENDISFKSFKLA